MAYHFDVTGILSSSSLEYQQTQLASLIKQKRIILKWLTTPPISLSVP